MLLPTGAFLLFLNLCGGDGGFLVSLLIAALEGSNLGVLDDGTVDEHCDDQADGCYDCDCGFHLSCGLSLRDWLSKLICSSVFPCCADE